MNITSKSRYGLKIMIDLAEAGGALTQRHDIATRQGIPLDYMDHVLSRLREAGLIASTRGRSGGYRLAKAASEVSVLEIFEAAEDGFQPVQCLEGGQGCTVEHLCGSRDAWSVISGAISLSLSGIILADIVAKKSGKSGKSGAIGSRVGAKAGTQPVEASDPGEGQRTQECRAPSRRRAGGGAELL